MACANVGSVIDVTDANGSLKMGRNTGGMVDSPLTVSVAMIEQALNVLSRRIRERRSRIAADCAFAKERESSL